MNKEYYNTADPQTETKLIDETADYLRSRGIDGADVLIMLGSGLQVFLDMFESTIEIPFSDIPNFPASTAPTHKGILYYGIREGKRTLVMGGRFHYYEGYPMHKVVFPVRVANRLGVKRLIQTNAAGAITYYDKVGTLMLITDHINMTGENPLIGPNFDEFGGRFPDMTDVYTARVREQIKERAAAEGIDVKEGVYAYMTGPCFETPAEIRLLRTLGADSVGMSTVPEATAASHCKMEVVAISCQTNAAAGILGEPLEGEDFSAITAKIAPSFARLIDFAISAE